MSALQNDSRTIHNTRTIIIVHACTHTQTLDTHTCSTTHKHIVLLHIGGIR